ncbi:DctP family TRAP transporter solute-binding subunit [Thalassobacillus sp. CUG 92003]|uniref:DctP family TRAP transporter solute-binding subunit n=1 Tax=Thalassobacillus sp. CUG 92003 TaxID=2736641 RepID=UPI00210638FF|nr:DctP family TRAP transporter solute-binding subunit [Thalassobacillus sp. CUG 92003]
MKWLVIISFMLLLSSCGSGGAATTQGESSPEYVFRFAHEESPTSVQQSYAEAFKKRLEAKSDGEIKVEIYPVGQLGNAITQAELLKMGAVDFGIISPGNVGTIVPESQVMLLNFLFSDNMEVNKHVLNNSAALNDLLAESFREKGIKVLSYWTEGFNHWTSNKKLSEPSSFNGLKFRTMPSPLIVNSYEAYGANPTPIPYEQVYSGLQLNMIEGQTNPLFAIEQMKFYEVQQHLTLSKHSLYTTTTTMNPDRYNNLPKDVQNMIDETVNEMKDKAFDIQEEQNSNDLKIIKENSDDLTITELSDKQRAKFREAARPVQEAYKERTGEKGEKILEQLKEDIAEAEKEIKGETNIEQ